jgi:hypothetical protein
MGKVVSSGSSFLNLRGIRGLEKALTTKGTKVHEGNLRMLDYIHALARAATARAMTSSQKLWKCADKFGASR